MAAHHKPLINIVPLIIGKLVSTPVSKQIHTHGAFGLSLIFLRYFTLQTPLYFSVLFEFNFVMCLLPNLLKIHHHRCNEPLIACSKMYLCISARSGPISGMVI